MKRLTERDEFGNADIIGVDSGELQGNLGFKELNRVTCALNRLAELEDKLESGQAFELPCKVGDTIYVVPSKAVYGLNILHKREKHNRIYKQVIDEVRITRRGWYLKTCDLMDTQVDSLLGETWFLTEAEAEAKLNELSQAEARLKELQNEE